ncbi:hypothetical protein AB0I81_00145 [Nonomuraea sp. NPDC050404]|uniref:hypothetical protein n=1 Tax=Nonomuraea sp. NPDC050404 TaxID=3155783 RepID=UPI0034041500
MLSAVAGIVAATMVFGPVTAASAADAEAARNSARWLSRQLGADGTLQNPLGGALPDHGLMIDTLYALRAAGEGELAEPIVRYLDDERHASDYFTWDGLVPGMGYDAVIVGGATAKVLVAAQVAGRDPRNFGGHDMVAETQGAIMRSGPDKGRVSDYSKNPDLADSVSNNANVFGQALGVIGLAGVGENDRPAIDTLIGQQCSEGYFRIFFGYIPTDETGDHVTSNGTKVSTCDEGKPFGQSAPDGDATGMALSALLAARHAGATGLDGPIDAAVSWLKANQKPGGGWGGGVSTEAPNTNSTGLIVQALVDAGGADDAVQRGTAYLESAQATATADGDSALGDQIGAIAYTPEEYQAARTGGIVGLDTWIRAGAQATLGLARIGFHDLSQGRVPPPGEDPGTSPSPTVTPTVSPTDNPTASPSPNPTVTTTVTSTTTYSTTTTITTTTTATATATATATSRPNATPTRKTSAKPVARPRATSRTTPRPKPRSAPTPRRPDSGPAAGDDPSGDTTLPGTDSGPSMPPQGQSVPATAGPAGRLGAYLAGRLVDGDHVEVTKDGETYVDYDASADLVLALRALGEQPEAVTRASLFLLQPDSIQAYAYGAPYEQGPAAYAEPLAKLQIIARFLQTEPAAPAGLATTADRLKASLAQLRTAQGRFVDRGVYGDGDGLVRRQAWAVLAITAGGAPGETTASLEALLQSQCSDGSFPADLNTKDCATGDLAATAAAITALSGEPRSTPAAAGQAPAAPVAFQIKPSVSNSPAGWSQRHRTALENAAAVLASRTSGDGLVRSGGQVDVALSAAVAGGRRAVGLDAGDTTRALGALLLPDGGFGTSGAASNLTASNLTASIAGVPGAGSDLTVSIAGAPGLAERSWLSAPGSPVTIGLYLKEQESAARRSPAEDTWPMWPLFALGAIVAAAGLGYAGRRIASRKTAPAGAGPLEHDLPATSPLATKRLTRTPPRRPEGTTT